VQWMRYMKQPMALCACRAVDAGAVVVQVDHVSVVRVLEIDEPLPAAHWEARRDAQPATDMGKYFRTVIDVKLARAYLQLLR